MPTSSLFVAQVSSGCNSCEETFRHPSMARLMLLTDVGQAPIRSVDPRTGEPFGPSFADATVEDVKQVVGYAGAAARELQGLDVGTLAEGLDRAADAVDAASHELTRLADRETALGVDRLTGEVARTTGQMRMFAALIRDGSHLDVVRSKLPEGAPARTLLRMNLPIGVVGVFAASNFPFAFSVAGGDTASAIAAGCPVVVKAHYGHPQTSQRVADLLTEAFAQAGLPEHVFQLIHGGNETGRDLVGHPELAAVGFTGSIAGGRALFDLSARREAPIPVFAEQGSLNPVVLAPTALEDPQSVASALASSITLGSGQFCTKPGLILLPSDYETTFVEALRSRVEETGPHILLTEKIFDGYRAALDRIGQVLGVDVWTGDYNAEGFSVPAAIIRVDQATLASNDELMTEVFGPATVVVSVHDVAGLQELLGSMGGHLTGTVHGASQDPWTRAAVSGLAPVVGRLIYGGVPTGVAVDIAMHHGGPYPACTSVQHTSVGTAAIRRFLRPIAYQDMPTELLPTVLTELAL